MIVTQPELSELIDSEISGEYYAGLTVDEMVEFRTDLYIDGTEINRGVVKAVEQYQGRWQLQKGKAYIVKFNEELQDGDDVAPIIMPSGLSLNIGGSLYPRLVTDNQLVSLFVPHAQIDVHQDSVLGVILFLRLYNDREPTKEQTEDEA